MNGTVWEGPLTIFRKWKLRGLGVCKYGVDGDTKLKFAQAKLSGKTVSVTRFSKGAEMSTGTTETPAADPAPTTPAVPAPAATPAASTEITAPAGTTQLSRKQQSEAYLKEFGEQAQHCLAVTIESKTPGSSSPGSCVPRMNGCVPR